MKILTIGNAASPHIISRAKAFVQAGCQNKILSDSSPHRDVGIEVMNPFTDWNSKPKLLRPYYFLKNIVAAIKILLKEDYDFCHIHYASHYLSWIASYISRKPIIVIVMGGDVLFEQHQYVPWYQKWLVKQTLLNSDLIIVKSPYLKKRVQLLCNNSVKIEVCLFGISKQFLAPSLQKNNSEFVFISTRPVNPFYNLDKIIDIIDLLKKQKVPASLKILCFSPDIKYLDYLKQKVQMLSLQSNVIFVKAQKSPESILELYQKANFVIALPNSDGIPQSALEGMAQGCINILPNNEVYKDIFNNGNSILVQGSSQEIVTTIINYTPENKRQSLIISGRKFVEKYGNLNNNIKILITLFKQIKKQLNRPLFTKERFNITWLLLVYFVDQFFLLGIRSKLLKK